jgi:hypothetical protein
LTAETFHLTRNSLLILLDTDLFFRHYQVPITHMLGNMCHDRVALSRWLARNLSIVSAAQLAPNDVNSTIPTTGDTVVAERPERYGRACIFDLKTLADSDGAESFTTSNIDLKGVGVAPILTPTNEQYCTGLLSVIEALEEYLWYRIIDEILLFGEAPFRCASIYGIIKLGFSMTLPNGKSSPAAIIFREPTIRNASTDLPKLRTQDQKDILALELMFRRFGVTSSPDARVKVVRHAPSWTYLSGCPGGIDPTPIARSAYPDEGMNLEHDELDLVNVQLGKSEIDGAATIVDFGQYKTKEAFIHPIFSTVADRPGGFGGIMWPDDPSYPQPDPKTKLTAKYWGQSKTKKIASILSNLVAKVDTSSNANLKGVIDRIISAEANKWRQCSTPQRL